MGQYFLVKVKADELFKYVQTPILELKKVLS